MCAFQPNNPIIPLNVAIKYDPPTVAIFYKRNQQSHKKHMYSILLNDLVNLNDAQQITTKLYQEHSLFVNEDVIAYDQMLENVEILLEFLRADEYYNGGDNNAQNGNGNYSSQFHSNNNMTNTSNNTFSTNTSKFNTFKSQNNSAFKSPENNNRYKQNFNNNNNNNNYIYSEQQQQSPDVYFTPHGGDNSRSSGSNSLNKNSNSYKQKKNSFKHRHSTMMSEDDYEQENNLDNDYNDNNNNNNMNMNNNYYYDNNEDDYDNDNDVNVNDRNIYGEPQENFYDDNENDQRDISMRRDTSPTDVAKLPPGFQIKPIQSNQSIHSSHNNTMGNGNNYNENDNVNTPLSMKQHFQNNNEDSDKINNQNLDGSMEYDQQFQINDNQSNIYNPSLFSANSDSNRRKRKGRSGKFGILKQLAGSRNEQENDNMDNENY